MTHQHLVSGWTTHSDGIPYAVKSNLNRPWSDSWLIIQCHYSAVKHVVGKNVSRWSANESGTVQPLPWGGIWLMRSTRVSGLACVPSQPSLWSLSSACNKVRWDCKGSVMLPSTKPCSGGTWIGSRRKNVFGLEVVVNERGQRRRMLLLIANAKLVVVHKRWKVTFSSPLDRANLSGGGSS